MRTEMKTMKTIVVEGKGKWLSLWNCAQTKGQSRKFGRWVCCID